MADGSVIIDTELDSSGLKTGLANLGKIAAAGITSAVAAVGTLTKAAVESYAEFEQLIGGVETLYGTEVTTIEEYAKSVGKSAKEVEQQFEAMMGREQKVLDNAANAYKTAGMSANEYMNTVNGFAASLTSSLGEYEWQAANYAEMIVTDMADNANKMGTSMEAIQNAYSGFAKQNYTMLDNLKLGYGGTKEEMERLLRDAEKYAGYIEGSLDVSNFADVADAIHIIQEEMGITGTTAKEAGATIQGSISMAKAAYDNFLTGLADENADLGVLATNLVESATTALDNLLPAISQTVSALPKMTSIIQEMLLSALNAISENLPSLLESGTQITLSVLEGVTSILPQVSESAVTLIVTLATGLLENLPSIFESAIQVVVTLATGISESLPELIPSIVSTIVTITTVLLENIDLILEAAFLLIQGLAQGLLDALPELINALPILIESMVSFLTSNGPKLIEMGVKLVVQLASGLIQAIPQLLSKIPQIVSAIVSGLSQGIGSLTTIGKNLLEGIWVGIKNAKEWLVDKVKSLGSTITNALKDALGIHSPSRIFRDEIGKWLPRGLAEGISDEAAAAITQVEDLAHDLADIDFTLSDPELPTDDIDYDGIIANAKMSVYADSSDVGKSISASIVSKRYDDSSTDDDVDDISTSENKPKYIQNDFYIDGKKVVRIFTPYIAKELDWEGK